MPSPIDVQGRAFLHRFTVRPGHLEAWWPEFQQEMALRERHGFTTHRLFVETDVEPKVSWIYSHPDPIGGEASMAMDPTKTDVIRGRVPHVFRNRLVRPVDVEYMTHAEPGETADLGQPTDRIAIMRRYIIVGSWDEFLHIWRRIVPLRERHGFRTLFAVSDREKDVFTWAFDYQGTWQDFPEAQRAYYQDPDRKELRSVMDYMADYDIHPAHPLR